MPDTERKSHRLISHWGAKHKCESNRRGESAGREILQVRIGADAHSEGEHRNRGEGQDSERKGP